jgi:oxygen-independent coproporphyrinogen-3 oxidase
MEPTPISLYVHVPFCAHKCEYCAFYSRPPSGEIIQRYTNALVRELEMLPPFQPHTIFFGGGTPSLLTLKQWEQIGETLRKLKFTPAQEWTVECNPATVSTDKAQLLRSLGVNRISMGVQSFDEALLDRLGRIHSREQAFKSFEILRAAGIDNLNLDLMFAIPGQTMNIWKESLKEVVALGPEHLSCYEVIYEEDTPLYAQLQAKEFDVDEDLACEMHEELVTFAAANGYHQYEVANFARHSGGPLLDVPSHACKHNVNYWRGGFYYAMGPSAAGYEPIPGKTTGLRTRNWANTEMYCDLVERGQRPIESKEELPSIKRAGEIAAFGLRMNAGWPFETFQQRTGFDLKENWAAEIDRLIQNGMAQILNGHFQLTPRGLRFADAAGAEFLRTE